MKVNEKVAVIALLGYMTTCVVEACIDYKETKKRKKEKERLVEEVEKLEQPFDYLTFFDTIDKTNANIEQQFVKRAEEKVVLRKEVNDEIFDELRKELDDMRKRCDKLNP